MLMTSICICRPPYVPINALYPHPGLSTSYPNIVRLYFQLPCLRVMFVFCLPSLGVGMVLTNRLAALAQLKKCPGSRLRVFASREDAASHCEITVAALPKQTSDVTVVKVEGRKQDVHFGGI